MVKTQGQITSFQLFTILFISRMVGTFTYMIRLHAPIDAGGRVQMMLFYFLFSLLTVIPVLLYTAKLPNLSLLTSASVLSDGFSRMLGILYALGFLWAAAITTTRFGMFAGTVLLQQTNLNFFILALLIAAAYCASKGIEPIARTSVIFAVLLLISLLIVSLSATRDFEAVNISPPNKGDFFDIIKQAFYSACRNVELTAIPFVAEHTKGKLTKGCLRFLAFFSITAAVLFAVAGGLMGDYGEQQMYPLYTLSVLAKFGFVERIDDFLTGIWVICAMLKISFLLYAAGICIKHTLRKKTSGVHFAIGGAVIFGGYLLLSRNMETFTEILLSALNPLLFSVATFLIPLLILLLVHIKKRRKKETNR